MAGIEFEGSDPRIAVEAPARHVVLLRVPQCAVILGIGESLGSMTSVAQSPTAGPGSLRAVESCCSLEAYAF